MSVSHHHVMIFDGDYLPFFSFVCFLFSMCTETCEEPLVDLCEVLNTDADILGMLGKPSVDSGASRDISTVGEAGLHGPHPSSAGFLCLHFFPKRKGYLLRRQNALIFSVFRSTTFLFSTIYFFILFYGYNFVCFLALSEMCCVLFSFLSPLFSFIFISGFGSL